MKFTQDRLTANKRFALWLSRHRTRLPVTLYVLTRSGEVLGLDVRIGMTECLIILGVAFTPLVTYRRPAARRRKAAA